MSSASPSSATEARVTRLRCTLWPRSLFGRLIATSIAAVLLAQVVALVLIMQERQRFVLNASVREWTRRISETAQMLQPLSGADRSRVLAQLAQAPTRPPRDRDVFGPPQGPWMRRPPEATGRTLGRTFVPLPALPGLEATLRRELQGALGSQFGVDVYVTPQPEPAAIPVPQPFFAARELAAFKGQVSKLDVRVRLPDGDSVTFRVTRPPGGASLPANLFMNLGLLLLILVVALYLAARSITRPLSELARAADRLGREARPARLHERGARELRDAARAFNTMQDRLRRYLDSRTRVLAAMSHDLKTPLTRLRLQVETLDDPAQQQRIGAQLDEMESMVRESLALFRGLDDGERSTPLDVDALLRQLHTEFADMGARLAVHGHARAPFNGKAQALKRCLTNLIANAVKFGSGAAVVVEDTPQVLTLRIRDEGPGIPASELERVFEPFYRLEGSRNRDSGGTGLGLPIARDIAQLHGGTLTLHNRPHGGLEAVLALPR
ncbi:MAG: HAMP domain-containing histidine kinase [Proteobacteria bacterium]|nr:HAMP domain-containing histidine kinase [Pseudomonadota bacterium]